MLGTGVATVAHAINRKVVFTEGAHHVAEAGGAFWLLDEIAIIQPSDVPRVQ